MKIENITTDKFAELQNTVALLVKAQATLVYLNRLVDKYTPADGITTAVMYDVSNGNESDQYNSFELTLVSQDTGTYVNMDGLMMTKDVLLAIKPILENRIEAMEKIVKDF